MNFAFRFLLVAALGVASAFAQDSAPLKLKIAFWNVEWFPGTHPNPTQAEMDAHIAKVVPTIESIKPDVIGLEEVKDFDAAKIAVGKLPGANVQVCSAYLDENQQITFQQTIIASRLPAVGGWWEAWKAGAAITPKRGFSFAAFQPAPGQVLLVYCVHLKSNRGEATENIPMREESARQLMDHVAAMEKAYSVMGTVSTVIGGDFNTYPENPDWAAEQTLGLFEKAGFTSCWKGIPFAQHVTHPSTIPKNPKYKPFPDACFDYIFVKGAKILSSAVVSSDPEASDHRPVTAEIELPGSANK